MNRAVGWLVRDVFRRARASGFSALLLGVTALAALVCLTARVDAETGAVDLIFGRLTLSSTGELLWLLASGIGGAAGVLTVLTATAGYVPAFLEPSTAPVLMSKPMSRAALLLGRVAGVVVFVALHAGLFVGATWAGVGIATGTWPAAYWLAWPLLVVQFLPFFAVSVLLAVATRDAIAALLGSLIFWLTAWAINVGRHLFLGNEGPTRRFAHTVELCYQALPRPVDFGLALSDALGVPPAQVLGRFGLGGAPEAGVSLATNVAAALAGAGLFLALAAYEIRARDDIAGG